MTEGQIMEKVLLPAIQRANLTLPNFCVEHPTDETALYGNDRALLDSLNLVSFVFIVEEILEKAAGRSVTISAADVLNQEVNPFSSLRALAIFLTSKLETTTG